MFFSKVVEAGHLYSIKTANLLRVCHWPAYYGISFVNTKSGQLEGIDIDLARELANDLEVNLEFVQTSFATFIEDIKEDKCDIAMFGVAITSQRAEHLDFSKPYLKSDIYAVTTKAHPTIKSWKDLIRTDISLWCKRELGWRMLRCHSNMPPFSL